MSKRPDTAYGIFMNSLVRAFRSYDQSLYTISLSGIRKFISEEDSTLSYLLEQLQESGFNICFTDEKHDLDSICVDWKNEDKNTGSFTYQVGYLPSISELSYRVGLSTPCILIMRIVARVISLHTTMYKALVLDLDDTLWKGTLSEEGAQKIKENLQSAEGRPFIDFMKFIRHLAEDLGLFVAICSRNDIEEVTSAIDQLDESIFPLKGQIDCIVANNNDKSKNLPLVIDQLSVLPNAIVFIDDNEIVRDDIKKNCAGVFVPEWRNHYDLISAILGSCIFDRKELSASAQNRRRIFRIIKAEKNTNGLPALSVKPIEDKDHIEARKLYSKSNQFRFSRSTELIDENCRSAYFEVYRENGEKLDTAAVITYRENEGCLIVKNFAMSCRYFEIGLEEFILLFINQLSTGKDILFEYQDTGKNKKVQNLFERYPGAFTPHEDTAMIKFNATEALIQSLRENTRLERI